VLGGNGAGKSTLLRIMAGVDKDFAGEAFAAAGTRIGFLPQEPQLDPAKTVLEIVEEAVAPQRAILQKYEDLSANWSDESLLGTAVQALASMGIEVLDQRQFLAPWLVCQGQVAGPHLPAGLEADVLRGLALAREPNDMLLLDEPTNHLDAESVAWLEQF
jgi:ATPase subunit of ABC transporter with duplicated ATPase domains